MMELEWLRPWVIMVLAIVTPMLVGWIAWSMRTRFVTTERFEESVKDRNASFDTLRAEIAATAAPLRTQIGGAEHRLTLVETSLLHAPSRDDVGRLTVQIAELNGKLSTLDQAMKGQEKLVERVESSVSRHEAIFAEGKR
jgi:hypothetical protein